MNAASSGDGSKMSCSCGRPASRFSFPHTRQSVLHHGKDMSHQCPCVESVRSLGNSELILCPGHKKRLCAEKTLWFRGSKEVTIAQCRMQIVFPHRCPSSVNKNIVGFEKSCKARRAVEQLRGREIMRKTSELVRTTGRLRYHRTYRQERKSLRPTARQFREERRRVWSRCTPSRWTWERLALRPKPIGCTKTRKMC